MTKEVTKAKILQEIQDKLALREFEKTPFLFSEIVTPVYSIEPHLSRAERKDSTLSITETGGVWIMTTPMSERWTLHRYAVIFITGSYTVAGVLVGRPALTEYVYLDLEATPRTTSYMNDLPKDVILEPGDGLYVSIAGYTSPGDLLTIFDVTVEKIR